MAHMVSAFNSGGGRNGFGRRAVTDAILKILKDGEASGVVLVGEYGVGKTFVSRQVIESLTPDSLVISLRCSAITATMPYSALSPVLNELGDISVENPLLVLRSVTNGLKERAKGRKIVFFVDNVQCMDDHSAMVVSQLAAGGIAHVLAACDSLSSAPPEIVGLWRDGLIKRIDLAAFSETETRQWLELMLGSVVSASAAHALWTAGGGNPRFLDVIVQEQISAGTLLQRDGVWVVTGAPFVCGHNSVDTVMAAFGTVGQDELAVAELLALAGGLALNELMKICDVDAIDALQQRGYVVISHADAAKVQLKNHLMAQVLREHVPSGRSRELRRLVLSASTAQEREPNSDFVMAAWSLDCGVPLDVETTISTARAATEAGLPGVALRIVNSLAGTDRADAALETARALMAMGDLVRARAVIFGAGHNLDGLSLPQWVELMLMRSAFSRGENQSGEHSDDYLDQIRQRLSAEEESLEGAADGIADSAHMHAWHQEFMMGVVEERMHTGRYFEVAAELERLHRDGVSSKIRLKAGKWLVGTWILTGRVDDAFRLAKKIGLHDQMAEVAKGSPSLSDSALMFAVVATLAAEDSGVYIHHWSPAGTFTRARAMVLAELTEGLVHAYNGRADQALEYLVPAASQLAQLGERGVGALASAASAYAHALKGEDQSTLACLNKNENRVEHASRLVNVAVSYFTVLATAELASTDKAIVRLLALADNEKRFRTPLVEMLFVLAAVRSGSSVSAQRLQSVASSIQGQYARICESLGHELAARDVATLLHVAEAAANLGDDLLSRDVARATLKIANDCGDREGSRLAQRLIRGAVLKLGHSNSSWEDGQVLTQRESEIASQAAAGESNKAIAAKMHISVRTVEGHLYQVYSKLQVTSRAELREILT